MDNPPKSLAAAEARVASKDACDRDWNWAAPQENLNWRSWA
jgi:hypothetical protein